MTLSSLSRRVATLLARPYWLFWLGGLLLLGVAWRWLRRDSLPVSRRTTQHPIDNERPTPIPEEATHGESPIQLTHDGTGKLFHRRYRADIVAPQRGPEAVMAMMQADPNDFSPKLLAQWEKTRGAPGQMRVQDEYFIHITGPWDGPVRVIGVEPTTFCLVTLEGHLEAGEIRFRFAQHPHRADAARFEILSWARSRDSLVDLAYDKLGVAKEAQTNMWIHFCKRAVEESGGTLLGEIDVVTEEQPFRGEVIPHE